VLVYQKHGSRLSRKREEVERYLVDGARVDGFFATWFKGDGAGPLKRRGATFKTTSDFEELLDQHLPEVDQTSPGYGANRRSAEADRGGPKAAHSAASRRSTSSIHRSSSAGPARVMS
jgi:hypothetical protein